MAMLQPVRSLKSLARRFESWRAGNGARRPIPATLWRSAVDLAGELGVYQVAKHLRLDYAKLKRLTSAPGVEVCSALAPASCVQAEFVEIPLGPTGAGFACRFEVRSRTGARLRADAQHISAPALSAILRDFGA